MSKLTLEDAIKHCLEVAEQNETQADKIGRQLIGSAIDKYATDCRECASEQRQLAEWLLDYKELKNSVGAVKLELLKETQAELEKRGNMLHNAIAELEEAKQLLKSAIDEWHIVCEWGNCGEYCGWFKDGKCSQKWSRKAEALKLIRED